MLSTFDLENSIEGQCSVCVFGEGRKRDGGGGRSIFYTIGQVPFVERATLPVKNSGRLNNKLVLREIYFFFFFLPFVYLIL